MPETIQSTQTTYPCLRYEDARGALAWLASLGFDELMVVDGPEQTVAHAEVSLDGGVVMLGSTSTGDDGRLGQAAGGSSVYVVVDDPDAHHERAKAAGAEIVRGLKDEDWGSRGYTARDPEGNYWSFGTYRPEVRAA